jgi:hypothetical protein
MYCSTVGFLSVLVYCSMYCSYYHKARKQLVDKVTYAHDTLWDMTYNITFVTCIVALLVFYLYLYTVACIVVIITRLANNLMITFVTCIVALLVFYLYLYTVAQCFSNRVSQHICVLPKFSCVSPNKSSILFEMDISL